MSARQIVTPAQMRRYRYRARKEPGRYVFSVDVLHDLGRSRTSLQPLSIAKRAERLERAGYLVECSVSDLSIDGGTGEPRPPSTPLTELLDAFQRQGLRPPEDLLHERRGVSDDEQPSALAESFAALPRDTQRAMIRRMSRADKARREAARVAHEAHQKSANQAANQARELGLRTPAPAPRRRVRNSPHHGPKQ